jgi:hypothetical protein
MLYATDTKFYYNKIQIISPSSFTYFADAHYIHLWLYDGHLYDNPFHPTRVSAYHGRPEAQQR